MNELWRVGLMGNTGGKLCRPVGKCLGLQIHTSRHLAVKVLLQLHFVPMMKSCFLSIQLAQQAILIYNLKLCLLYIYPKSVCTWNFQWLPPQDLSKGQCGVRSSLQVAPKWLLQTNKWVLANSTKHNHLGIILMPELVSIHAKNV